MDQDTPHTRNTPSGSRKAPAAAALYKLHLHKATGTLTLKHESGVLRIYLQRGHAVFADGLDQEGGLLREMAAQGRLDPGRLAELERIGETDPHSLGEALLRDGLISAADWKGFIESKVRHVLRAVCRMETPEVGFSASPLEISPVNFIDRNLVQLLLETLREVLGADPSDPRLGGTHGVFKPSRAPGAKGAVLPLSPTEEMILSMIDGRLSTLEIIQATGLEPEEVYPILHLLHCFGLISEVRSQDEADAEQSGFGPTIGLYLELLAVMETHFRREAGREFEHIFERCKRRLSGRAKVFCRDLRPVGQAREEVARDVCRRLQSEQGTTEGRLLLCSIFNRLLYLMLMDMKNVLGLGLTEKALQDMMQALDDAGRCGQDPELVNYVQANLADYRHQMRA